MLTIKFLIINHHSNFSFCNRPSSTWRDTARQCHSDSDADTSTDTL